MKIMTTPKKSVWVTIIFKSGSKVHFKQNNKFHVNWNGSDVTGITWSRTESKSPIFINAKEISAVFSGKV